MIRYTESVGMCAGQTWHLANDMQFFLVSIIICIIFLKKRMIRNIIFITLLVGTSIFQIVQSQTLKFHFNDYVNKNETDDFLNYVKPWCRMSPYIIGFLFCELYLEIPKHLKENKNSDLSDQPFFKKLNYFLYRNTLVCYMLVLLGLSLIVYSSFFSYVPNHYTMAQGWHSFMITFNKQIFVFGVFLIAHLTYLEKLSFLRSFFGMGFFSRLSKLTYGVNMLHKNILVLYYLNWENVPYFKFRDSNIPIVGFFNFVMVLAFLLLHFSIVP